MILFMTIVLCFCFLILGRLFADILSDGALSEARRKRRIRRNWRKQ